MRAAQGLLLRDFNILQLRTSARPHNVISRPPRSTVICPARTNGPARTAHLRRCTVMGRAIRPASTPPTAPENQGREKGQLVCSIFVLTSTIRFSFAHAGVEC